MTESTPIPDPIQFPQYQPPVITGPEVMHPKQSAPLYKMMKAMMKPKAKLKRNVVTRKSRRGKRSRIKFH